MHRGDRRIGAVAFGFGCEAEYEYRPKQCSESCNEGERPRTCR